MSNKLRTGVALGVALAVMAYFFIFNSSFSNPVLETINPPASQGTLTAQDEIIGSGAEAQTGDTVVVNYTGRLENGTVFDTSLGSQPYTFVLGSGNVIPGWDLGITGMREGGKRMLIIPSDLAYGGAAYGPIPPNSTLIFEVELVDVIQVGQ